MTDGILDRVDASLADFRPRTQREFVALQIARRFNDTHRLARYVLVARDHPKKVLLEAARLAMLRRDLNLESAAPVFADRAPGGPASRPAPSRLAPVWNAPVTPSPLAPAYGPARRAPPTARAGASGCEGAAIRGQGGRRWLRQNSPSGFNPTTKATLRESLADAELHIAGGPLDGLKLIGFSIWERRTGTGRKVTFPARQYSVNGERRSFALLRPVSDPIAQDRIRDLVLQAYAKFEDQTSPAS